MDPGETQVNLATGETEFDDGTRLRELLRAGALVRAKVNPDTGSTVTTQVQAALDTCPDGCTLLFEPGLYICNGVNWTRSNIGIYLAVGAVLQATSATAKAVINIAGTVDTGAGTALVQSPATDIVFPRADDRTIYVSAGAEAGFLAGSWLWIEDDEVSASGTPTDTELEFWKHGELVRVKSTASGVINLYSPLINTYAPQVLANNALTSGTGWSVANGFTLSANTAVYAHNASGGTLTQTSGNFLTPVVPSVQHVLTYEITASTVAGGDLTLSGVSASTVTGLSRAVGVHSTTFTSHASPGNMVLTATSSSGGFTMDNVYLSLQPRIRTASPVQNARISGAGTIRNAQAGSTIAHGVRLFHTVGTTVEGITFEQCWDSGLHATRSTEIKVQGCTFKDAVRFDSRGYGFTCHASSRVTVSGNSFKRLRHCIDFSVFSRLCTATGNNCIGSTTGNINTHPSVVGVTISGNTIDGGHGQDATSNSTEYGDSTVQASGINIDQGNKNVTISGNVIMNMRFSGIMVDFGDSTAANFTEFVTIDGNAIDNCQLYRRVTGAGALGNHAGIALLETQAGGTTRRGIVCSNNVLREPGQFGILVGIDHAMVIGNHVYKAEDKTQAGTSPTVGIGIWAKNSTSTGAPTGVVLRNNVVTHCTQDGIRVGVNAAAVNTINCVVEGNQCISNGSNGIFLEETAQTPMVRNNFCQLNATDGINNQASSGWFINNRSISNTSYGLRLVSGGNNNFVGLNLFAANGTAALLDSATGTYYIWLDDTNGRLGLGTSAPDSPLHVVGKIHGSSELELDGDLNHDGSNIGFFGATPVARSTGWSVTNETTDKTYDADATSVDELADVLGTLIEYLITTGILGA